MIRVFVDARERGFLAFLGDLAEVTVSNLEAGDYVVVTERGAVMVERKSYRDFVGSFRSGRLWEQLVRMLAAESFQGVPVVRRVVAVERSDRDLDPSDGHEASVLGAEMECVFTYGVPIVFLEGRRSVERFLRVLIDRERKGKNDAPPEARWYRPRFPSELPEKDQRRYLLCAIPGIGDHLAGNLLERYGSVDALCRAGPKELEKVPGFGKKRARELHEFLHAPTSER